MKRRGWRVALTAAASGMAVIAGLVAFNWATVRDHAEAWRFVKPLQAVRAAEAAFVEEILR